MLHLSPSALAPAPPALTPLALTPLHLVSRYLHHMASVALTRSLVCLVVWDHSVTLSCHSIMCLFSAQIAGLNAFRGAMLQCSLHHNCFSIVNRLQTIQVLRHGSAPHTCLIQVCLVVAAHSVTVSLMQQLQYSGSCLFAPLNCVCTDAGSCQQPSQPSSG